jgi:hypothetical protein
LTSIEINSINESTTMPQGISYHILKAHYISKCPTYKREGIFLLLQNERDLTPKFVVCGGHLISINFPPINIIGRYIMPTPQGWEGNYAYL